MGSKGMSSRTIQTHYPATGKVVASYEIYSKEKVSRTAKKASAAFESRWSRLSIGDREDCLKRLARVLRSGSDEYARTITTEMGKPITQAKAEVEKCAWTAEVYSEKAERWMEDEIVATDAKVSRVTLEPLGVILSIMPWNFPFWQVLRFAIPTLVAGNTTILRHSNVCPGSALKIEEAFQLAEFPDGVFSAVITDHKTVLELIESAHVSGVSLTGSTQTGKEIGGHAARNLKKVALELGGSDPFIVLGDADVKRAAKAGAGARLQNSGQSCSCAKRFIVSRTVADEFMESFVKEFGMKRIGDPLDMRTEIGPLVGMKAVKRVAGQVRDATAQGATVETGGRPRSPGAFYEPTVLGKAAPGMKVMTEEVFGPVAPVSTVRNEGEAIRVANDSEFGLGASIWTSDVERAKRLAREVQGGVVFINEATKSDPRMPFGGVKSSGIGRELSRYGLMEFANIKSVNVY